MGIWHRVSRRVTSWLNQRTATSRRLVAQSTVLGEPVAMRHRLMARAYFSIAASTWDESNIVEDHFDSFEAGLANVDQARHVLDLGTGAGGSAAMVAKRFPEATVIGIDVSRRMLRLARHRHSEPNLEFRRASLERLPFPDRSFDLVTLSNAVPKLAELARVAEDGARILITNTFVQSPDENMWMPVWTKAGFRMLDSAEVARGYWQLWEREAR